MRRVIDASKIINLPSDRQIIHALPRYFTVDGQEGVNDPVGMSGGRLEVDTHIVTGSTSFITNVLKCVERAGLETQGVVFEPLASSAATLLQEEKQVGVVLLDIGGGTTDIAVYSLGSAIYTATIPVGGNILTSDISLGLKTTLAEAEESKSDSARGGERRSRSPSGRSTAARRASMRPTQLRQIVVPRVLETLRMARQKIVENVPRDLVLGEVVLDRRRRAAAGHRTDCRRSLRSARAGRHAEHGRRIDRCNDVAAVCDGDRTGRLRRKRQRRRRIALARGGSNIGARVQRWLAESMDLNFFSTGGTQKSMAEHTTLQLRSPTHAATIKVIGIGGGGCNAVNRMVAAGLAGVDFFCGQLRRASAAVFAHRKSRAHRRRSNPWLGRRRESERSGAKPRNRRAKILR